ncbi:hypothetical protein SAMN05216490_0296 [Mucilaginibacter mallensis]|uniref:Uncharacterized protein n=1 Tax=Mucilaginibacter mallensis TaxID=652787 RepID=A0A1H1NDT1_MUCMA|nr:hypothetical protein SAMN05216490_0296 [Mucilaginibacter mallensis]
MSKKGLIFTDIICIIGIALLTYDLSSVKNSTPLIFLALIGFATCLRRHVNYYKLNKKIY